MKRALLALVVLAACADDDGETREGPMDAARPTLDATATMPQDAGPDALAPWQMLHPNMEQARRVPSDGTSTLVDEQSAEQVDYFVFRGRAGAYYEISTDKSRYTPDNTLQLLDESGKRIAASDDGSRYPDDALDARVVIRLPADGDYYVRIEDLKTPASYFVNARTVLYYHLTVRELTAESQGYAVVSSDAPLTLLKNDVTQYLTAVGTLVEGRAKLSFSNPTAHALIARIHTAGADGNGSTLATGTLRVSSGGRVVSAIELGRAELFDPPIESGTVEVSIETGAAGDNPFYAIDLILRDEDPGERGEPNDGAETASVLTLVRGRGALLSRLPAGDVDLWKLPVTTSALFSCEAESAGSGVRGLEVELLDAKLSPLSKTSETVQGASGGTSEPVAGPLYLRLHGSTPVADVEPWVRCAVAGS